MENAKKSPEEVGSRILGNVLVATIIGVGVYIAVVAVKEYTKNRELKDLPEPDGGGISPNVLPNSGGGISTANDNFPLKQGSRGIRVANVQNALLAKGGVPSDLIRTSGGADGIFGPKTEAALSIAGFPKVLEKTDYDKLVGGSATSTPNAQTTPIDPASLAHRLKSAVGMFGNPTMVFSVLEQLKSTQDYEKVRAVFGSSIVDAVLGKLQTEEHKAKARQEFLRMGLKLDPTTQKWSLTGAEGAVMTNRPTWVRDQQGNYFTVPAHQFLGVRERSHRGITKIHTHFNNRNHVVYTPTDNLLPL